MYEELMKELRGEYGYDSRVSIRVMKAAADAIEFFSNRLCDACGVCPDEKRNPFNCEIAGTDNE